ncbi:hypothetical protein SNEBB_006848 [Seison nebaliae]|nr:hypothetical protein SNEBB_006848 [Seison nebaliae]
MEFSLISLSFILLFYVRCQSDDKDFPGSFTREEIEDIKESIDHDSSDETEVISFDKFKWDCGGGKSEELLQIIEIMATIIPETMMTPIPVIWTKITKEERKLISESEPGTIRILSKMNNFFRYLKNYMERLFHKAQFHMDTTQLNDDYHRVAKYITFVCIPDKALFILDHLFNNLMMICRIAATDGRKEISKGFFNVQTDSECDTSEIFQYLRIVRAGQLLSEEKLKIDQIIQSPTFRTISDRWINYSKNSGKLRPMICDIADQRYHRVQQAMCYTLHYLQNVIFSFDAHITNHQKQLKRLFKDTSRMFVILAKYWPGNPEMELSSNGDFIQLDAVHVIQLIRSLVNQIDKLTNEIRNSDRLVIPQIIKKQLLNLIEFGEKKLEICRASVEWKTSSKKLPSHASRAYARYVKAKWRTFYRSGQKGPGWQRRMKTKYKNIMAVMRKTFTVSLASFKQRFTDKGHKCSSVKYNYLSLEY